MPSRLVTSRQKSANSVIAAARTHGPLAADSIASVTQHVLAEDETPPNVTLFLELCARGLEASIGQVVAADDANELELADDTGPRRRRDELKEGLRADIGELKEVALGLLGRSAPKLLGLTGTTPRDPVVLTRHVENVVKALRTAELPKSRVSGAMFHAEQWALRLEKSTQALSSALADVAREAREAEATLVAKHRALDEYDRTFGDIATFVSAVLRMGGQVELAGRVRPSRRRPGHTAEIAEINEEQPKGSALVLEVVTSA